MSRSAAERFRAAALAAALGLAGAIPAASQAGPAPTAGVELTRSVQQSLKRLQEQWLQWMSAFYQDSPARADEALRQIMATSRQVGFTRLPDFALGAAARAVDSATAGNPSRAAWALEAADAFDPGRPETAFARAAVARASGRWVDATSALFEGYQRLVRSSLSGVVAADLLLWALLVLLVAGAFFVTVQMAVKGSSLLRDLRAALTGRLPPGVAIVFAVAILLGPLVLPGGLLWALLLWSALLWGYQSLSERIVTGLVWIIVAAAPAIAAGQQVRIALEQSPPLRALASFGEGRLYGTFFSDLQVLRSVLGTDPAALELLGDVHRTLGQWEVARTHYRQVLEAEPDNVAVLINFGAYSFRKGNFALANEHFQRAAAVDPPSAAAHYNLSLSYSDSYQFEESTKALDDAKQIDAERVDSWVRTPNPDRVLTFNGSLSRGDEIRAKLRSAWLGEPAERASLAGRARRWGSVWGAGCAALLAVGLHLLRRRRGYGEPVAWLGWDSAAGSRWVRALVPPLSQAEVGEGFAAFGTLLGLAAVLLLPALSATGVDLPVGATPGRALLTGASALLLVLFAALRVRGELVDRRG